MIHRPPPTPPAACLVGLAMLAAGWRAPGPAASNGRPPQLAPLDQPLAAVPVHDVLYVAQKTGKVVVLRNGVVTGTVLDLSGQVSGGSEQGLLGIAVAGNHLFVDYT